ncbi:MAG: hypothetical protein FJ253_03950, partial [Phycisphaerae bacterium]|nr:hypothetical protein [Phycisphaerae bacterium]
MDNVKDLGRFAARAASVSAIVIAAMAAAGAASTVHASDSPASHLTISVERHADPFGNSPYFLKAHLWLADTNPQQVLATI